MTANHGIAAINAALPVQGADIVGNLRDKATPALPSPVIASSVASMEVTQLSITGKLLAALLQTAPPSVSITHAAPMLAAPTAEAPVIAAAIQKGIETSGLFYESHLADWITGQRDIESLTQEPQMRDGATDDLPAIVRQQLDLLDNEPLQWRGALWPGMPLQLQVEQYRADAEGDTIDDARTSWTSTLVSQLPTLGSVTARLRIEGERLQLKLQAGDSTSALLSQHAAELREALALAGLILQRLDSDGERPA